ncbi:MAG TPA: helix-turn-helix transcriptional regulator [Allocoleopsis sp.]
MLRIRELRRRKGFTQNELAAIAGLCAATVGLHERGKLSPNKRSLKAYAYALGVEVEELRERTYQVFTEIEWRS